MFSLAESPNRGWWTGEKQDLHPEIGPLLQSVKRPFFVLRRENSAVFATAGQLTLGEKPSTTALPVIGYAPSCRPEALGDTEFCRDHGLRFPYVAGAMANGISSIEMVEAMGFAGLVGIYGAAGLAPETIEDAIDQISTRLGDRPWGCNLIFSPYEQALETAVAELYIRRAVHLISASAYIDVTLPVVQFRVHGIHADETGRICTPNKVIAKVSRIEVAKKFLAPPPDNLLTTLVQQGKITEAQARMASKIPLAQDLTAEADSGGHTDNRPALALLPTMLNLRDRLQGQYNYSTPLRVGVAGGIATPDSAAAAFAMGAAYLVTGSVNQSCLEAGTSDTVRQMLAETEQADVTMAPSADMFEMGVRLQVLKRGTLFAMRAHKLYDLYCRYGGLEDLPQKDRSEIEKSIFRDTLDNVWRETEVFWSERDPQHVERARNNSKHKMALVFRWYLGHASRWANAGLLSRKLDYQVWCGPAMGAFNEWVRGSYLESWQKRRVVAVALNILHGAAVQTRANALRGQGFPIQRTDVDLAPKELAAIEEYMQ